MKKLITATLTAGTALLVLAGCSTADGKPAPTTEPKPSATATASTSNVCADGILTVTDSAAAKKALKQGCDTVYLLTSDVELELGAVKTLGIEGNGNTVTVESLGTISIEGTDNTVTHGGAAPKHGHVQDGNTITAK